MQKALRELNLLRRLLHRAMQPLGEELGLSQPEMELLLFLKNNPELNTARDAVAYRGLVKSNVSTAASSLEEKGWLQARPDPRSRRVKRLYLSEARSAELERLSACQSGVLAALLEGFSEEETAALRRFLDRVAGNAARELERLEGEGS